MSPHRPASHAAWYGASITEFLAASDDHTRQPGFYQGTYRYLASLGIEELA